MRRFTWKESHAMIWKEWNDKGKNNREHDWLPAHISSSSCCSPTASHRWHAPQAPRAICVTETHSRTFPSWLNGLLLFCFTADTNHYDVHSSFTCRGEHILRAGESFMAAKAHEYCRILIALFVYLPPFLVCAVHSAEIFLFRLSAFSLFVCLQMANRSHSPSAMNRAGQSVIIVREKSTQRISKHCESWLKYRGN